MTKIDSAVRRAAAETAVLAGVFGTGERADEIIAAACARHERLVIKRIIDKLQLTALTDSHDELSTATLVWFATELDNELGPSDQAPYTPRDGDVLQLTLTGTITSYETAGFGRNGQGSAVLWELQSAEGIIIPLAEEDFETLGVIKLA